MLDFGMLPPEVNSTLMYSGPGSGPLMAAASAWDALTAQLDSFALGYSSVIAELQQDSWAGAAAQAMVSAATPYVTWATATADLTGQAAGQARAVAAAYETAHAATVPPAAVTANRAELATLIATNFFGQNTAMIAAVEAAYAQMWAQDAAAMYGYAAAASTATELAPFREPPRTTNPGARPGPTGAPPGVVTGPSGSSASSALPGVSAFNTLTHPVVLAAQAWRTVGNAGNFIMSLPSLIGGSAAKAPAAAAAQFRPVAVLASAGEAVPMGTLSVPASWPAPAAPGVPAAQPSVAPLRDLPRGASRLATGGPRPPGALPPPGIGPMHGIAPRRRGNLVFRMREDRRFQMPRPAVGG